MPNGWRSCWTNSSRTWWGYGRSRSSWKRRRGSLPPAGRGGGGPVVQAYKARLFDEVPELDLAVKGEGERVFCDLLGGARVEQLSGVLYRANGGVAERPDSPEIAYIDGLPFPAYDLVDLDLYARQLSYTYNHRRQGILLTSRGCVYHCTYCFTHWKNVRLRSATSVFAEIEYLYTRHP